LKVEPDLYAKPPQKLRRLIDTATDCYFALRLAGFDQDKAQQIVIEELERRVLVKPYETPKEVHDAEIEYLIS
jgi:hypothetical protein